MEVCSCKIGGAAGTDRGGAPRAVERVENGGREHGTRRRYPKGQRSDHVEGRLAPRDRSVRPN